MYQRGRFKEKTHGAQDEPPSRGMLAMAVVSECGVAPSLGKTDDRGKHHVYTWPTNLTDRPGKSYRPNTEYRNAEVQCK